MKEGHPAAATTRMKEGHPSAASRLREPSCNGLMKEGHPAEASRMEGHPEAATTSM
jgi:hypothetical protein